jgi:hypothetical protein
MRQRDSIALTILAPRATRTLLVLACAGLLAGCASNEKARKTSGTLGAASGPSGRGSSADSPRTSRGDVDSDVNDDFDEPARLSRAEKRQLRRAHAKARRQARIRARREARAGRRERIRAAGLLRDQGQPGRDSSGTLGAAQPPSDADRAGLGDDPGVAPGDSATGGATDELAAGSLPGVEPDSQQGSGWRPSWLTPPLMGAGGAALLVGLSLLLRRRVG